MDENFKVDGDVDPLLMEVPLSFLALDKSKVDVSEKRKIDRGDAIMVVPISSIPPQVGILLVYHHLETKEKFRSMIDVYKFLLYGEIPEKKNKKSSEKGKHCSYIYAWSLKWFNFQVTQIRETRMRGSKLMKHYVVGTYRMELNYFSERDIPSNIETEDLFGHQQVNLESDALSAQVNSGDVVISSHVKSFFTFGILSS
ncbi:hypothetical protein R3W88_024604 [Solanum pinnatisectum]|uniref:Uncharacterized protein n=1 Tax=Solanum pinnatisectum TaxID=50273 RepID=A0AAV9M127_9SOLN|nr:hypothetical protein R3W88_024604 [Solanum pinnatisectum]